MESEKKLQIQQEELQVTNEELEEKNRYLERGRRELERATKDIEKKAEELALASKYKSEFLANMSHELRTPLNGLLLLARRLSNNKQGNLSEAQVKSALAISQAGHDLLSLINEILDLSKVEAGRMDLHIDAVKVSDLADSVRASFAHVIEDKGLTLRIDVDDDTPEEISTDQKRLGQILKNLISNAIKFTAEGSIAITFRRPKAGVNLSRSGLDPANTLAIAVRDTGIGIAPDKQKMIFQAFQQADGSTSRRYGGTGLGLSISLELARLLGAEIQLESQQGEGSVFTLYTPIEPVTLGAQFRGRAVVQRTSPDPQPRAPGLFATPDPARPSAHRSPAHRSPVRPVPRAIDDDRETLEESDRAILIIEDDETFARILLETCHAKGLKCLAAATGEDAWPWPESIARARYCSISACPSWTDGRSWTRSRMIPGLAMFRSTSSPPRTPPPRRDARGPSAT